LALGPPARRSGEELAQRSPLPARELGRRFLLRSSPAGADVGHGGVRRLPVPVGAWDLRRRPRRLRAAPPTAGAPAGVVGCSLGCAGGEGAEAVAHGTEDPVPHLRSEDGDLPAVRFRTWCGRCLASSPGLQRQGVGIGSAEPGETLDRRGGHVGDDALRRFPPWRCRRGSSSFPPPPPE
jgi:hypothetical protein